MKTTEKQSKKLRTRPYIKNTLSLRCEVYTSDKAAHPISSSGMHTSFRIPLLPIIIAAVAVIGGFYLALIKKIAK